MSTTRARLNYLHSTHTVHSTIQYDMAIDEGAAFSIFVFLWRLFPESLPNAVSVSGTRNHSLDLDHRYETVTIFFNLAAA